MMDRVRKWLQSAAGKISMILLIISIIFLIIAFSSWGNFTDRTANNINNFLFFLATNLLGIIVTVSFVQFFIDKQNHNVDKQNELEEVLRYDRVLSIFIEQYTLYYRCITTPVSEDMRTDYKLNADFAFKDMGDMYEQNRYMAEGLLEPAISVFYRFEDKIREYMMSMLNNISFKYYIEIENILEEFVEKSFSLDTRGNILGNISIMLGKEKITDVISKSIKDSTCDWIEVISHSKNANIMAPYVQLYFLLKDEADLLTKYKEEVDKLATEKNI